MSTDRILLPLAVLLASAAFAAAFSWGLRARRKGGDIGDLWARVLTFWGVPAAAAAFLSSAVAPAWQQWWTTGYHLQADRVFPRAYHVCLIAPVVLFVFALFVSAARGSESEDERREQARWVAGGIGFSPSRTWILWPAAPLGLLLAFWASDLGGGEEAYPAAVWSVMVTFVVTLAGVAGSAGRTKALPEQTPSELAVTAPSHPHTPWPEALRAVGVIVEPVTEWAKEAGAEAKRDAELRRIAEVLEKSSPDTRSCLLRAPDDAGQIDLLARLAARVSGRQQEVTLVVTPADADALAAALGARRMFDVRVGVVGPDTSLLATDVWISDAETLSDSLLPRLGDPGLSSRIGLVVWWDVHAYSGVLAANMWAVSRRLDRLIRTHGREDVRTLAFARPVGPEAQQGSYVRRLLPQDFRLFDLPAAPPRPVRAFRLAAAGSTGALEAFLRRAPGSTLPVLARHAETAWAFASVTAHYETSVAFPGEATTAEREGFLNAVQADHQLAVSPSEARAHIRPVDAGDVLDLRALLSQTGRKLPGEDPSYVGVLPSANPYVQFAITQAREGSRRLVCAEARPRIVERHLLLALAELEDTRENLRTASLWNEEAVERTLAKLDREGKLKSQEVRWLGKDGRLRIDRLYKSLKSAPPEVRPLDTAGVEPILVVDPSTKDGGVRWMVDRERLPIVAYPHRVIVRKGARYEVRDWQSIEEVWRQKRLDCQLQDAPVSTYRKRDVAVFDLKATSQRVQVRSGGRALARQAADVTYEETVRGALVVTPDVATGKTNVRELTFKPPIRTRFETQALVLELPDRPDHATLASVAQAFRHVLPVHLGVEEDAVELVPIQDANHNAVAIVDLFPGGMGLVGAIADDDAFLLRLVAECKRWLSACSCQQAAGCPRCLRSVEARAANPDDAHRRSLALDIFSKVVPE